MKEKEKKQNVRETGLFYPTKGCMASKNKQTKNIKAIYTQESDIQRPVTHIYTSHVTFLL